jgi:hypothetical protein
LPLPTLEERAVFVTVLPPGARADAIDWEHVLQIISAGMAENLFRAIASLHIMLMKTKLHR